MTFVVSVCLEIVAGVILLCCDVFICVVCCLCFVVAGAARRCFSISAKKSSVFCSDIIGSDVYLSLNGCWFPLVVVGVEWLYVDSLTRL